MKTAVTTSEVRQSTYKIALRRRSTEHPMAMFAIVTGVAMLTMAFVPTAGPSLVNFNAPAKINDDIRTTAKVAELPINSAAVVCRGQTWGDENEACLLKIAQDSGKGDRLIKIRKLANAEPNTNTPNIF